MNDDFIAETDMVQLTDAIAKLFSLEKKQENNDYLYHYTTTDVMQKVLEVPSLRAGNLFFMNDYAEYEMGAALLKDIFSKMDDSSVKDEWLDVLNDIGKNNSMNWSGIYSISFSKKEDIHDQWVNYAKENGVCLEFDRNILTDNDVLSMAQKSKEDNEIGNIGMKHLIRSIYNDGSIRLNADEIINTFNGVYREAFTYKGDDKPILKTDTDKKKRVMRLYLQLAACCYKSKTFCNELEERFLTFPIKARKSINKTDTVQIEYYNTKSGVLRPYIREFFINNHCLTGGNENQLPITSIIIGPGGGQQLVYQSVVHYLQYGKTSIWRFTNNQKEKIAERYSKRCREDAEKLTGTDADALKDLMKQYALSRMKITEEQTFMKQYKAAESKMKSSVDHFINRNFLSKEGVWVRISDSTYRWNIH